MSMLVVLINVVMGFAVFLGSMFLIAYLISVLGAKGGDSADTFVWWLGYFTNHIVRRILYIRAFITKNPEHKSYADDYKRNLIYQFINDAHYFMEHNTRTINCPHCHLLVPVPSDNQCMNCKKFFDEPTEEEVKVSTEANRKLDEEFREACDRRIAYLNSTQE